MPITARVIADSVYDWDLLQSGGLKKQTRITTMVLRYPRFVHAEFMTHRVFSRNASSSRAIPVKKMLQAVLKDPACPVWWGRNQSGMQAREELTGWRLMAAKALWFGSRYLAVALVWLLSKVDLHKQIANRLLEPWMHIEVVVTSTRWPNFYALRDHADAQPEMRALAVAMLEAHRASTPVVLTAGQWHLPFITLDDRRGAKVHLAIARALKEPDAALHDNEVLCRMSAARCARVSYLTHEGKTPSIVEDLKLYDRLAGNNPKHASPLEHQAMALPSLTFTGSNFSPPWLQFRKMVENENVSQYEEFTE